METPLDGSPVIADDLVFIVSRNSTATAVESDTGDMVWSADIGAPSFSWVAIDQGNLFVVTNNGLISGLDAATGHPHREAANVVVTTEVLAFTLGHRGTAKFASPNY